MFYGSNAQGKTALLEAAYTLAIGRAFRAQREREVLNFDAARCGESAYITGNAISGGQSTTIVVGYQTSPAVEPAAVDSAAVESAEVDSAGEGSASGARAPAVSKQIRINRQPFTASGLIGRVGATLFVADDLDLVLGSPSHRRRYLDVLISQAFRPYLEALQRYQAALRNRNGLLRRQRDGLADPDEMAYWDGQLTETGATVVHYRAEAITDLGESAREHHRELAAADRELTIEYRPSVPPTENPAATAESFLGLLRQTAGRERLTAVTGKGPHRDDFAIFINSRDAGSFASRGEARTIALALRLAEADYLAKSRDDDPIILLDDVFSEIDAERRERVLLKAAAYRQTLATTTDADLVRSVLGDAAAYFHVADGVVSRET